MAGTEPRDSQRAPTLNESWRDGGSECGRCGYLSKQPRQTKREQGRTAAVAEVVGGSEGKTWRRRTERWSTVSARPLMLPFQHHFHCCFKEESPSSPTAESPPSPHLRDFLPVCEGQIYFVFLWVGGWTG